MGERYILIAGNTRLCTAAVMGINPKVFIGEIGEDIAEEVINNIKTDLNEKCWKGYTQKGMKTMFGKKYQGIDRSTFLINKIGKISAVWRSVSVKGHVEQVLKELSKISK